MTQPPPDSTLSYATPAARISRLAKLSFYFSLFSIISFFFVLPGLVSLILAAIADNRIKTNPDELAGRGYTRAASIVGACTFLFGLFTMLAMPCNCGSKELANRSSCAANLRGIMNACILYADAHNDQFPIVTYAPYSPALNSPTGVATSASADDTIISYYRTPNPQAGSVTANLWLLTLQGLSPKMFMCKSDSDNTGPAKIVDSAGRYFNDFQGEQLSYSFAYPWKADGAVGKWWSNTSDASIPLASDMAPQQGTGKPARILNPASTPGGSPSPKTWSSGNHQGDGQNVAFADCHVDYVKRPTVGQSNDNIWTTSANPSTGPAEFNGLPATKSPPNLTSDGPEFDIIMSPIRNLDTGHL